MLERYDDFCPGCRARNRVGSNFCARCGIRLASPAVPAAGSDHAPPLRRLRELATTVLAIRRSLESPLARRVLQTTFTVGVATGVILPPLLRLAGRSALQSGRADRAKASRAEPEVLRPLVDQAPGELAAPGDVIVHILQVTQIVRRVVRDS